MTIPSKASYPPSRGRYFWDQSLLAMPWAAISMGTFFVLTHYQAIFRLHLENFIRHTLSTPSEQIQVVRSPTSQTRELDANQVLPQKHRINLAPKQLIPRGGQNDCHGKSHNNVLNKEAVTKLLTKTGDRLCCSLGLA